jgi:hypothetical protein
MPVQRQKLCRAGGIALDGYAIRRLTHSASSYSHLRQWRDEQALSLVDAANALKISYRSCHWSTRKLIVCLVVIFVVLTASTRSAKQQKRSRSGATASPP